MGHDLWLMPSTFHPKAGERIDVSIFVGTHFKGESIRRYDLKIERFNLVGPGGEKPVVGRNGADPAGVSIATQPGIWALAYISNNSLIELEPEKFASYLKEEGLERILEERAKLGESSQPGREAYSRSVKSLIRAGLAGDSQGAGELHEPDAMGFDRSLGLPLEFIPEQSPYMLKPGQPLSLRLLQDGKPYAGALVRAYHQGHEEEIRTARTDAEGRVSLTLERPGVWMIATVTMRRADGAEPDVQWKSTWSTLTFEIPVPDSSEAAGG